MDFTRMFGLLFMLSTYFGPITGESAEEWLNIARADLDSALKLKANENVAKNVIIFIGDGMGMSTITAARVLKAQLAGQKDKQPPLSFETFPSTGLLKTYSNDRLTSSSAATATALLGGVKINDGTVGVSPAVAFNVCDASMAEAQKIKSVLKLVVDEGKSAGFVTNARVTHATPAASYAHSANRYWEGETEAPAGCKDIAAQMFDNVDMKVMMGGGRRYILLNNQTDPETGTVHAKQRGDGRDLIKEWKEKHSQRNMKAEYVYNKGQFDAVNEEETDYLLGLFAPSHMAYDADRDNGPNGEPSLAEMTRKAIRILKKNTKGFGLLVEGARIDHAHHLNYGKRALIETIAMDAAVAAAVAETDEKDTLIIVTADHSHVFNIVGYPSRENDILGFVDIVEPQWSLPTDKGPYTTLIYGNGPASQRTILTGVDTTHIDFQQPVAVQMPEETHGAEDVPIYARGPMSHLFHGVHEQHYTAHVMAYASCVGSGKRRCTDTRDDTCVGSGSKITQSIMFIISAYIFSRFVHSL